MKLSMTDWDAVERKDGEFLLNKGAKLYQEKKFKESVEYYRLAASMGEEVAFSNLGYCYLYGRAIEPDLDLAIAYFKMAAKKGNIDAMYKLGDIFSSDKWERKDMERSDYYLNMALNELYRKYYHDQGIYYFDELDDYPSLCLACAVAHLPGGSMFMDLRFAYELLIHAKRGYETALENGSDMYQKSYEKTLELLEQPQFEKYKKEHEEHMYED